MKAYPQIEITMYCKARSNKSNREKNVKWLKNTMPVIMKSQDVIRDEFYLAITSEVTIFYLS